MVSRKAFDVVNAAILILLSASFLLPFLVVISRSLMTSGEILRNGYTLFPEKVVLDAYRFLLVDNVYVYRGFLVSGFVTVAGTFLCLLCTSGFAYGLSKKYLPYRSPITIFVLVTMFFSGGLIPGYLLVTALGLKDSLWSLIVPSLIVPWNLFLLRNFFMELPEEIEESAFIDGASAFTVFFRITLSMSLPALATIGLFYAVGFWNSWFPAAIYISSQDKWPLQLILKEMVTSLDIASLGGANPDAVALSMPKESVKAAMIMITSLPIICVYPFVQKYFVKGMLVGSLKG